MKNQHHNLATWVDLPGPGGRFGGSEAMSVVVPWNRVIHALLHLEESRREPWHELLGDALVRDLRAARDSDISSNDSRKAIDQYLEQLETQLRQSLRHPLIISHFSRPHSDTETRWRHYLLAVLPCGAVVLLADGRPDRQFFNCYFPVEACRKTTVPKQRWRKAVRQFVRKYAEIDESSGRYRRPSEQQDVEIPQARGHEVHSGIEYLNDATWGFEPARQGEWNPNRVHSFDARGSAGTAGSGVRRIQLQPRYRMQTENSP